VQKENKHTCKNGFSLVKVKMHSFSLGELASKVNHTSTEIKNGNLMVAVLKRA